MRGLQLYIIVISVHQCASDDLHEQTITAIDIWTPVVRGADIALCALPRGVVADTTLEVVPSGWNSWLRLV